MTGHTELHLPGTEPTSPELARARHNQRRERLRHRLANAGGRMARYGLITTLSDSECARLEDLCTQVEQLLEDYLAR